jgi:hypothetical protein
MPHNLTAKPPKPLACVLLLLFGATLPAFAQSSDAEPAFAPFVSRFRLAISDPQVLITWEPAPGPVTGYALYRSPRPINSENLLDATLIDTLPPEAESYVDIPPEPGTYHYAIVVLTQSGAPIQVVIPGRNASFRPVPVEQIATDLQRSAEVERLSAAIEDSRTISITLDTDRPGRTIALYRSTSPINTFTSLSNATLFREVSSETEKVLDFPVPGVEYYYAAADTARILAGEVVFEGGTNVTTNPVALPLAVTEPADDLASEDPSGAPGEDAPGSVAARQESRTPDNDFVRATGTVRSIPLPFLQLQNRLTSETELEDPRLGIAEPRPLSAETRESLASLLQTVTVPPIPEPGPSLLPADTTPEPEGADYTLRTILEGPFEQMAWEEALEQLDRFFMLPLTNELAARGHFYRAQLYYHLGEHQASILEFLLARERYYVEVEMWLSHILSGGPATTAQL